jgi:amino acid adenylation domain-containing protein
MLDKFHHGSSISERFIVTAGAMRDSTAIATEERSVSYRELLERTNSLALTLRKQLADKSNPVGILAQRNADLPLSMLACLLAGVPFFVLDSACPKERITSVWEASGARTILYSTSNTLVCDKQFRRRLGADCWIKIDDRRIETELIELSYSETAYIIFTSGTNGFPKGIRTGSIPLLHFIDWYRDTFEPGHGSRFSMLSGLSHDPILRDIFVPLLTGGELHIPKQSDILSPDKLHEWMRHSAIQYAHVTPQLIGVLAKSRLKSSPLLDLRYVFSGGDVLGPSIPKIVKSLAPDAQLINFYGASETPQAMVYRAIQPDSAPPFPLGKPIPDVKAHILNDKLEAAPCRSIGEIAIETKYLSQGYLRSCAEREGYNIRETFLSPFSISGNVEPIFLTGDLGYKDENGDIYFCGRSDDQVKIRGHRVDCAEVACTLIKYGLTEQAVILPERNSRGETILVAYVTGTENEIKLALPEILPSYMMPNTIIHIDQMPLLPNGKTDRAALRSIGQRRLAAERRNQLQLDNSFLKQVAEAMDGVRFDPSRSYVELSGDSLSYIRVSLIIEERLGYLPDNWENIPLSEIFADAPLGKEDEAKSPGRSFLTRIQPPVLFRAIGIILVIYNHLPGIQYALPGTSTLFIVAGMSFARFQLPGIVSSGQVSAIFKFVAKFAIPAAVLLSARGIYHDHLWIPDLFLLGTFWQDPDGAHFTLWFLDVLGASILIMTFAAKTYGAWKGRLGWIRKGGANSDFWFAVLVFLAGIVAMLIQTNAGYWNGDPGRDSVGPFRWFWMLPFGAAIQLASTRSHRLLITLFLALMSIPFLCTDRAYYFKNDVGLFFVLSAAVLLWFAHISLPRFFYRPITLLASYSLFIYIVFLNVISNIIPRLNIGSPPWLCMLLPIVVGIAVGSLWNVGAKVIARGVGHLMQFQRGTATRTKASPTTQCQRA